MILQNNRIDTIFLTFLQCHEDSFFGVIIGRKVAYVIQIPRVHIHANEIAAAYETADGKIADFANGHFLLPGDYFRVIQIHSLESGIFLPVRLDNQSGAGYSIYFVSWSSF